MQISTSYLSRLGLKKRGDFSWLNEVQPSYTNLVLGSLPGGKVDNEVERDILQSTLKREIDEEVGLQITDNIELVYNNSFIRSDSAPVVNLTFLCHWKSGKAQALEDTANIKWCSLEELRNFPQAEDFLQMEIDELVKYLNGNGQTTSHNSVYETQKKVD